jgi:HAD superfamily hydrolase (TIGR01509 family)
MVKSDKAGVRGVFIDLDGTLVESLAVLRRAYDRFLAEAGEAGSTAEFEGLNGPRLSEVIGLLSRKYALSGEPQELLKRYNALIDEAYLGAEPTPGSLEFVGLARARGWRVTVVTSNTESRARAWLKRHGFHESVDGLVSGEQVSRGKPAPDPYELALAQSGAGVESSFAIEDSPQGAQSARAAGLRTFAYAPISRGREKAGWPEGVTFIRDFNGLLPLS